MATVFKDALRAKEDYAAACCAIHNILLTAWERGIGMQWSTSGLINDPESLELLQISPVEEEIIGFLYTGYPAEVDEPTLRTAGAEDQSIA